jgi:drug/metabolite transporter (DMT)-like permease
VKRLTETYAYQQVLWACMVSYLALILAIFLPQHGLALLRTRHPVQQLMCSMSILVSTLLFFSALKYVGVAEAISIFFVAPLAVVFLAWPMLGERITPLRLASVVLGFAGALIVIRPGSSVFQWASLVIVAAAIVNALYQIFLRRLAGGDHASTTVVYCALGGIVVVSAIAPFGWKTPDNGMDVLLLGLPGLFMGLGHYCAARAMSYAPANFVAPFSYTQLIASVIVGYFMFAEVPDLYTWLGSLVIVAAGLMAGRPRAKKA